jgi:RNA polymerase sigma-70 factor (ECF subfamily)
MIADTHESERVRRAVQGDRVALTLYLKDTRARLREQIQLRIPGDLRRVLDADDIVQETHVEVFRRVDALKSDDAAGFRRWIATIAIHNLRDAIKRERAEKRGGQRRQVTTAPRDATHSTILLLDLLSGTSRTPSVSAVELETVAAARDAVDALPERHRRAVTLVYLQGRAVADAATEMGVTHRAIHGLCRRGLVMLRERLGSQPDFRSWVAEISRA